MVGGYGEMTLVNSEILKVLTVENIIKPQARFYMKIFVRKGYPLNVI